MAADILEKMQRAGIEHPALELQLVAFKASKNGYKKVPIEVNDGHHTYPLEMHWWKRGDGQIDWNHYDLLVRRQPGEFEHFTNNGIDSRELEQRIAALDWSKHP